MDAAKSLIVVAPLLLVLLVLGGMALRGHRPARPLLNAIFSLLLLLYLLVTAGLGLFWVARQQLPVFDWHYLAGYTLLLLVLVHLGFNLRTLWRQLRMPAVASPPRRRGLGLLLGATLLAAGFALGRLGRRVDVPLTLSPDAAWSEVLRFHALSSHSRSPLGIQAIAWGAKPPAFKSYPAGLPRRHFDDAALLNWGRWLRHGVGIREWRAGIAFRHSPSSGALFASELYLLLREGSARGLWHVDAEHEQLVRLADDAAALQPAVPALLIATALFRRSGHKYGERCYRYVLADLGHLLENLLQAGTVLGLRPALQPAFDGAAIAAALGIDENEEGVLALIQPQAMPSPAGRLWQPPPLQGAAPLGATNRVHRATSLQSPTGPAPLRSAVVWPSRSLPELSPRDTPDLLSRIRARRSRRRFDAAALTLAELAELLRAVTRSATPALSEALRLDLLSPAVDGLEPAAWRYEPSRHRLYLRQRHAAGLRALARAAALDQDVIGDAAVVWIWSAEIEALGTDAQGPARGYRHALLEAGRAGERLYLAAEAMGLGVCGVGAFYDEEVRQLLGPVAAGLWPLHLAALGRPSK